MAIPPLPNLWVWKGSPCQFKMKALGLGEPIPKSSWSEEVRDLDAVELIRLRRDELMELTKRVLEEV